MDGKGRDVSGDTYAEPKVDFLGPGNVRFGVEGVVELEGGLEGFRVGLMFVHPVSKSACNMLVGREAVQRGLQIHTFLPFKNRTVSSVFSISGIFPFRPSARRSVLACMNWYFLLGLGVSMFSHGWE